MEAGGKRAILYLSLHCHHQNDFCIKMGSDESHFNVSVGSDGQIHKTVSTNHNLFEEKRESKRYRTEVLPRTSLRPVLNFGECLFVEYTSDSSTNYDSFLNRTFSSPNMVRTVRRTFPSFSTGL